MKRPSNNTLGSLEKSDINREKQFGKRGEFKFKLLSTIQRKTIKIKAYVHILLKISVLLEKVRLHYTFYMLMIKAQTS